MTDALFDRADAPAEIRVFGIRHHGPGSARAVLQALAEFEPDTVLIEGPSDADPVLALAPSGAPGTTSTSAASDAIRVSRRRVIVPLQESTDGL